VKRRELVAEERVVRSDISNRIVPEEEVVKVTITFGRPARRPSREFDASEVEIKDWIELSREKGRRRGTRSRRRAALGEPEA
jgi:hypothetical protein